MPEYDDMTAAFAEDAALEDADAFVLEGRKRATVATVTDHVLTAAAGQYVLLAEADRVDGEGPVWDETAGEWVSAPGGGSGGGAVDSVNGATGTVVLDADDIDDTSTVNKFATAAQLAAVDGIGASITAAINALLDGAPGALDTLNELAAAVNDDASFAATVTTALAGKQPLDGDLTTLSGAGNSAVLAATTASFTTADETRLDSIEAGADVTDATNVAAAGAVMALSTVTKINGPITQAAYDLLTPDADTLYVIVG